MRTALTLQDEGFVKIFAKSECILKLNEEGKLHSEYGLPERRLLKALIALGGKAALNQTAQKAGLDEQFTRIALSWTLRKKWATYDSKTNTLQAATEPAEGNDEKLLNVLRGKEETTLNSLEGELQDAVVLLKKRQFLIVEEKASRTGRKGRD